MTQCQDQDDLHENCWGFCAMEMRGAGGGGWGGRAGAAQGLARETARNRRREEATKRRGGRGWGRSRAGAAQGLARERQRGVGGGKRRSNSDQTVFGLVAVEMGMVAVMAAVVVIVMILVMVTVTVAVTVMAVVLAACVLYREGEGAPRTQSSDFAKFPVALKKLLAKQSRIGDVGVRKGSLGNASRSDSNISLSQPIEEGSTAYHIALVLQSAVG